MQLRTVAVLAGGITLLALAVAAILPGRIGAPGATIGGPFTLTDGAGNTVTDANYRGRFMLVYFGYTHCPDACPTTLNDIALALDKLSAADRAKLVPLFITVDPARDTPHVIGDYAHAFGPNFVGLTGTPAQIGAVEQAYHVYAARHPLAHGDYAMDHSSILYVMAPDGSFVGIIPDGAQPGDIAQRLRDFGV
jgi:protein SCO1/2